MQFLSGRRCPYAASGFIPSILYAFLTKSGAVDTVTKCAIRSLPLHAITSGIYRDALLQLTPWIYLFLQIIQSPMLFKLSITCDHSIPVYVCRERPYCVPDLQIVLGNSPTQYQNGTKQISHFSSLMHIVKSLIPGKTKESCWISYLPIVYVKIEKMEVYSCKDVISSCLEDPLCWILFLCSFFHVKVHLYKIQLV